MSDFKSGFISIIGMPNVGKSTLMNNLVGQKISIVSSRAQTTRNKIMGVVGSEDYQIVFMDTPGIIAPKNKLGEYMINVAYDAINDVDAVLFMIDASCGMRDKDEQLAQRLKSAKAPVIAVLNKIDLCDNVRTEALLLRLKDIDAFDDIICISATTGENITVLLEKLKTKLIAGPKYFPDDMVTDQPERVICGEIIREKALILLAEEVPHGIGVSIDKISVRENAQLTDVYATIYCERSAHKGIIIGKSGAMLKKIGSEARKDIETLLGMRVNLQLWVKVNEDWRNKASVIRELGYE